GDFKFCTPAEVEPRLYDRTLTMNGVSKSYAMTGWRVGWIQAPASLGQIIENMIQYSVSGVPVFSQRAAIAALEEGDAFIASQVETARRNRETLVRTLAQSGRVRFTPPPGAFYLFFSIDGVTDARSAAFKLVDKANIGLAPGSAFGPGGEAFFRLCFARRPDHIVEAARRLEAWIAAR
ncbi:MAG: aminotransferase class I/II-fold pyridoxal phosphate-dependent enzyme, partial [Beijerinckiaceae bacterium]|nr:aminotransferase class I/II-fold pyridoxal phosphate-dependent enzyme [Beijerinckiaceae bacterium]